MGVGPGSMLGVDDAESRDVGVSPTAPPCNPKYFDVSSRTSWQIPSFMDILPAKLDKYNYMSGIYKLTVGSPDRDFVYTYGTGQSYISESGRRPIS